MHSVGSAVSPWSFEATFPFERLGTPGSLGLSWTFQDFGLLLRLACGTAVKSVHISVSGLAPVRDEPVECLPWTRRTGVCPLFPLPGNVGVRSGQQEAYAKVICQDLTDY